jgi:alkyl sulfatase BDS1-like metallo-beta-lactamase superfamily hydrolase
MAIPNKGSPRRSADGDEKLPDQPFNHCPGCERTVVAFYQQAQEDVTEATSAANGQLFKELPFDDTSDFDDAKKRTNRPSSKRDDQGRARQRRLKPEQYSFIKPNAKPPEPVNQTPGSAP